MTETKFTPGAWHIDQRKLVGRVVLMPDDRVEVRDKHGVVAFLYRTNRGGPRPMGVEDAANAHLIAAAPELYEALETLVHEAGDWESHSLDTARSALAKARGETV